MQILVTGGAGFIGSNLAEYHLARGDKVRIVDDLSTGSLDNIQALAQHKHFQFIQANLLSCQDLDAIVAGVDRIYHLAAIVGVLKIIRIPEEVLSSNISMTEGLLAAARRSKSQPRILLASSSEVYGDGKTKAFDEHCPISIGSEKSICQSYIVSKVATEAFGLAYFQQYGLAVTSLRIFNTIGPRQTGHYGMVVPRFVEQAVKQQAINVYGSGKQVRSFSDVRDVVQLMDLIAQNPKTYGKAINVGKDESISILALAQRIKKFAHSASPIEHVPYHQIYGPYYEDMMFRKPNLKELMTLTDYQFQWDLDRSLQDLIQSQQRRVT